ncbi:MAG: DUF4381 domain-containing protein [bacterium]
MTPTNPLDQLRDIHLPDPVAWWPPAPGWWLLGIVIAILILLCVRWFILRRKQNVYRVEALHLLSEIDDRFGTNETQPKIHAIVALLQRTGKTAQADSGWESRSIEQLIAEIAEEIRFTGLSTTEIAAISQAAYCPPDRLPENLNNSIDQLIALTRCWIRKHRRVS